MFYFIVNKQGGSGRGAKKWKAVKRILLERNVAFKAYETKYPGHAEKLARKITSLPDREIRLIVAGGDGTINEVLNGISDFERVLLGVIPIGSANDFVTGLGLPGTAEDAMLSLLSSIDRPERRVDIGRVMAENGTDRLFGISSGIGLDAIVCKKVQQSGQKKLLNFLHLGSLSYELMTVETLFSMKKYSMRITLGNRSYQMRDLIFLAGMNLRAEGGGVPMCPDARPDDGKLSVCLADGISRGRAFMLFPSLIKGKHNGKKGFMLFDTEQLILTAEKPMVLHADGEYLGDVKKIRMSILPGKLRLFG